MTITNFSFFSPTDCNIKHDFRCSFASISIPAIIPNLSFSLPFSLHIVSEYIYRGIEEIKKGWKKDFSRRFTYRRCIQCQVSRLHLHVPLAQGYPIHFRKILHQYVCIDVRMHIDSHSSSRQHVGDFEQDDRGSGSANSCI